MPPSKRLRDAVDKLPLRVGQRKGRNVYLAAYEAGGELRALALKELRADLESHGGSIKAVAEANGWHRVSLQRIVTAMGLDDAAAKMRGVSGAAGPHRGYREPKRRENKG